MCNYSMSGVVSEFQKHYEAGKRRVGEQLLQRLIP